MERGHGMRRAVLLMYTWTALLSFGVMLFGWLQDWEVVVGVVVVAIVLSILTLGRSAGSGARSRKSRLNDRPEVKPEVGAKHLP